MFEAKKEQIEEWKKKYGSVFLLSVEGKACYLRQPSRKTLSYASAAGRQDALKFNEILLNECWLGGDEDIRKNDSLFLSVSARLSEIVEIKEAELVKL
jgi:hypothetical protein